MKKRCSLCGGKLVNRICTKCGLNNTKTDESYVLDTSGCENQPLTHVHTTMDDPYTGKTITRETLKEMKRYRKKPVNRQSAVGVACTIVVVIFLIAAIGSALFENL